MHASPRQIVVLAAGVVAIAVAVLFVASRARPDIPTRLTLINVDTGQLYRVNLARHRTGLPARDPLTGEYALFPVEKQQDRWTLTELGRGMLRGSDVNADAVDLETGEVLTSSDDILEYKPPNAGERDRRTNSPSAAAAGGHANRLKETP